MSRGKKEKEPKRKKKGLWKMTPLWESKRRGFPQRFGKHKTLSTVPTRPGNDLIFLFIDQEGVGQIRASKWAKSGCQNHLVKLLNWRLLGITQIRWESGRRSAHSPSAAKILDFCRSTDSQLRRNDQSDQLARKLMKHPAFLMISAEGLSDIHLSRALSPKITRNAAFHVCFPKKQSAMVHCA